MRKIVVFYAWQSDRPGKLNRNFIEKALEDAVKRLNAAGTLGVEIEIDQDTQGLGGTPPVSQEILRKIAASDVFVGDVTFVGSVEEGQKKGTPVPNPNVMVEYGHALSVKGWGALMPVMNVAYGGPQHLPFDMGHLRHPLQYSAPPDIEDDQRREARTRLSANFENALQLTIAKLPPAPPLIAAAVADRARQWRSQRVRDIATNPPVPMLSGPRLALHLVPASAFGDERRANFSVLQQHYGNLVPHGFREKRGGNFDIAHRPDSDVWTVFDPRSVRRSLMRDRPIEAGSSWYAQVHLNGVIEIVTVLDPLGEPEDIGPREFRGDELEQDIVTGLDGAALTYAAVGTTAPALATASLIGVERHRLIRSHSGNSGGFSRPIVELPNLALDAVTPPLGRALRPLLDDLWRAAGWPNGSHSYFNGDWTGYPLVRAALMANARH